jgi:hypothetical protein
MRWREENSSLDCSFEMCIKLRSNNTNEYELKKKTIAVK